jgi:hypothetical protein
MRNCGDDVRASVLIVARIERAGRNFARVLLTKGFIPGKFMFLPG